MMYVPIAQVPDGFNAILAAGGPLVWSIRTRGEPYSLSAAVQNELRQASGGLGTIRSMDGAMGRTTARSSFNTKLLSIFAGCSLLLAAIGIYGLVSYLVNQRRREVFIRVALGATGRDIRNMIVFQGMRLVVIGIAVGLVAALALTRFMRTLLFRVNAMDPVAFTVVPLFLIAVAYFAVWLPARRSSRVDTFSAAR